MEVSFQKANGAAPIDVESKVVSAPNTDTVAVPVAADLTPAAAIPTQPAPSAALVPAATLPVAPRGPVQYDDQNIGFEDVILPRINIVQKVGDLSNIFNGGEIVLNKQTPIHEPAFVHPTDPSKNRPGTGLLIFTVLGFRPTQYTEKVAGGKLGMLLNNEADVAKNGGTLDYKEWKASVDASKLPGGAPALRRFEKLATALVLIEKPAFLNDEDHVLFSNEFEGKYYALALWSMKGVAYTHGSKVMFTARKIGHLKTGYTTSSWGLTTKLEEYDGGNFAYEPVLSVAGKNSDAFRKFCAELVGGGN